MPQQLVLEMAEMFITMAALLSEKVLYEESNIVIFVFCFVLPKNSKDPEFSYLGPPSTEVGNRFQDLSTFLEAKELPNS